MRIVLPLFLLATFLLASPLAAAEKTTAPAQTKNNTPNKPKQPSAAIKQPAAKPQNVVKQPAPSASKAEKTQQPPVQVQPKKQQQQKPPTPAKSEGKTPAKPVAAVAPQKTAEKAENRKDTPKTSRSLGNTEDKKGIRQLAQVKNEFSSLVNDSQRAQMRHHWLNLEERIVGILKTDTNNAEALLLAARTRDELAIRSQSGADFTAACERYSTFLSTAPKDAGAPYALLRQATILSKKPDQAANALALLQTLQRDFPQSPQAESCVALRKTLEKDIAEEKRVTPVKDKQTSPVKAAGTTVARTAPPAEKATLAQQLGLTVRTIMIDAGHGGKDPGTTANNLHESDFAIKMAKRLGAALQEQGFTVKYTRTKDSYLALQERPLIANREKADIFISVHANANTDPAINGLETYYLDTAQSHSAATAAARENGVDESGVSDLQFILSDLTSNNKLNESRKVASLVHKEILRKTQAAKLPMADNSVRAAPFYVLMGAKMPAILIEFGYLTHEGDAALLQNERFLRAQAQGVAEAVSAYKKAVEK